MVEDPQLIANGLVVSTTSGEPGYDRTLATPFKLHGEAQRQPDRAPTIGEHSREILREAGLDDAAIEELFAQRVAGAPVTDKIP